MPPIILALNLLSFHDSDAFQTFTPGINVQITSYSVGVLRNSEGSTSFQASKRFESGNWAVNVGVITGYKRAKVLPLVLPSYGVKLTEDSTLRLGFIPKFAKGSANVLHIMWETEL